VASRFEKGSQFEFCGFVRWLRLGCHID
jgi:hypothetical protein